MKVLVEVQGIQLFRQNEPILEEISFALHRGSLIGLTGPNGAGKTSLFEIMLGFLASSGGQMKWTDHCLKAYLPQASNLRRSLPISVHQFLMMALWSKHRSTDAAVSLDEAIHLFNLETLLHRRIADLSGGEWKKITIARCLMQRSDIYFLDEPFNHLDLAAEEKLGHLMRDVAQKKEKTFFVISHDWHAMDHFLDRLILLNRKVLAEGTVQEVEKLFANWRDPRHHRWIHGGA